jgi:hypothetical protein
MTNRELLNAFGLVVALAIGLVCGYKIRENQDKNNHAAAYIQGFNACLKLYHAGE